MPIQSETWFCAGMADAPPKASFGMDGLDHSPGDGRRVPQGGRLVADDHAPLEIGVRSHVEIVSIRRDDLALLSLSAGWDPN